MRGPSIRVRVDRETGCWHWLGGSSSGRSGQYGRVVMQGERRPDGTRKLISHKAHKFVYEQVFGPIPEGHELHHRCETPRCVNPAHLEPLTEEAHDQVHRELLVAA